MQGQLPETLDRGENLDLAGRQAELWVRRAVLLLFVAFIAVGLANVFGQRASTETATGERAALELTAPGNVRSGLIYQARFRIEARRTIEKPQLVLSPGWFDGLTINTFQPDPVEQSERQGEIVLTYDTIAAGEIFTARLQYQVNPTAVGTRSQAAVLADDGEPLAQIERTVTIFP